MIYNTPKFLKQKIMKKLLWMLMILAFGSLVWSGLDIYCLVETGKKIYGAVLCFTILWPTLSIAGMIISIVKLRTHE